MSWNYKNSIIKKFKAKFGKNLNTFFHTSINEKKNSIYIFPHLYAFGGGEIFCEYLTNYLINFYNIDLYFYKSNKINKNQI